MKSLIASIIISLPASVMAEWYVTNYHDDIEDTTELRLQYEPVYYNRESSNRNAFVSIGCLLYEGSPVAHYMTIEFGSFAFINAGGSPDRMIVKRGKSKPIEDGGWEVWKDKGSRVTRYFLSAIWGDVLDRMVETKTAYRVQAYDTAQYDVRLPPIPRKRADGLLSACLGKGG